MRRILITIIVALAALAGAGGIAIASSDGSDVTRARLERALPVSFANQYVQLAPARAQEHHSGLPACDRHV